MRVFPERVEGLVCRGSASQPRCAPIGPLATPRDPRARLCPQAGRTDASPVRPARATPVIEACAAARFSPKADGRARCATAEARLRRRVLHGSAFRHVRRNRAARIASGGVWRRAAEDLRPRAWAQEEGKKLHKPAPKVLHSSCGQAPARKRFSRWRRPRRAQRPRRGYPPRQAANAAPARFGRCKGCARSGRHAECPVEMDAARRPRPGGWTRVRRRGMRTMGCAISTGRRGAAAGARFQIGNTHRQKPRAPRPRRLTEYSAGVDRP